MFSKNLTDLFIIIIEIVYNKSYKAMKYHQNTPLNSFLCQVEPEI